MCVCAPTALSFPARFVTTITPSPHGLHIVHRACVCAGTTPQCGGPARAAFTAAAVAGGRGARPRHPDGAGLLLHPLRLPLRLLLLLLLHLTAPGVRGLAPPPAPVEVGGTLGNPPKDPRCSAVLGDHLYVGTRDGTVEVFDVTGVPNSADPTNVFDHLTDVSLSTAGSISAIVAVADLDAVLAAAGGIVYAIDVRDPENPGIVAQVVSNSLGHPIVALKYTRNRGCLAGLHQHGLELYCIGPGGLTSIFAAGSAEFTDPSQNVVDFVFDETFAVITVVGEVTLERTAGYPEDFLDVKAYFIDPVSGALQPAPEDYALAVADVGRPVAAFTAHDGMVAVLTTDPRVVHFDTAAVAIGGGIVEVSYDVLTGHPWDIPGRKAPHLPRVVDMFPVPTELVAAGVSGDSEVVVAFLDPHAYALYDIVTTAVLWYYESFPVRAGGFRHGTSTAVLPSAGAPEGWVLYHSDKDSSLMAYSVTVVTPPTPRPPTPSPPSPAPATPAPATTAPATPIPATGAPSTPAPATNAPATPAPPSVAPATVAPPTPLPQAFRASPIPPTSVPTTVRGDATQAPAVAVQTPATPGPTRTRSAFGSEAVDDALTVLTQAAAAVASGVGGSGGSMRLVVVARECAAFSVGRSHPRVLHPTQLVLMDSASMGMVVGNLVVILCAGCFMQVLVGAIRKIQGAAPVCCPASFDAYGFMRFPSAPLFCLQFLYQGTTLGALELLIHNTGDAGDAGVAAWCIGGVGVLVTVAVPCAVLGVIRRDVPGVAVFQRDSTPRGCGVRTLIGDGEWISIKLDTPHERYWVNRYASVVRRYTQPAAWFLFVECAATFCIALVHAFRPATHEGCAHVRLCTAFIFMSMLGAELVIRPHHRARDTVLNALLYVLQALGMFLMAVEYYQGNDAGPAFEAAGGLFLTAAVVIVVKGAMDVVAEVYTIAVGRRAELQAAALEALDEAAAGDDDVELRDAVGDTPGVTAARAGRGGEEVGDGDGGAGGRVTLGGSGGIRPIVLVDHPHTPGLPIGAPRGSAGAGVEDISPHTTIARVTSRKLQHSPPSRLLGDAYDRSSRGSSPAGGGVRRLSGSTSSPPPPQLVARASFDALKLTASSVDASDMAVRRIKSGVNLHLTPPISREASREPGVPSRLSVPSSADASGPLLLEPLLRSSSRGADEGADDDDDNVNHSADFARAASGDGGTRPAAMEAPAKRDSLPSLTNSSGSTDDEADTSASLQQPRPLAKNLSAVALLGISSPLKARASRSKLTPSPPPLLQGNRRRGRTAVTYDGSRDRLAVPGGRLQLAVGGHTNHAHANGNSHATHTHDNAAGAPAGAIPKTKPLGNTAITLRSPGASPGGSSVGDRDGLRSPPVLMLAPLTPQGPGPAARGGVPFAAPAAARPLRSPRAGAHPLLDGLPPQRRRMGTTTTPPPLGPPSRVAGAAGGGGGPPGNLLTPTSDFGAALDRTWSTAPPALHLPQRENPVLAGLRSPGGAWGTQGPAVKPGALGRLSATSSSMLETPL